MAKNNLTVFERIKSNYDNLRKSGKKLADLILKKPEDVIQMSISQLAKSAGLKSESTVVKFYRDIGFSSYHEFKVSLASDLAGKSIMHSYKDIFVDDDVDNVKQKFLSNVLRAFHDNFNNIPSKLIDEASKIISDSNRIICLGYGASAPIAKYAAFRFSTVDKEVFFSEDSHLNALVLSKLKTSDCILTISYSGETKDVIVPLQNKHDAKIISITSNKESSLGKISDIVFEIGIDEISMRTDALISRYIQMSIIDILFTVLAIKGGEEGLNKLINSRKSLSYLKF